MVRTQPRPPVARRLARLAAALVLAASLGAGTGASAAPAPTGPTPAPSHGGAYRGPALPPNPVGTPGGPGGAGAGGPSTGGAGYKDADPAAWGQWWALNRDPLLGRFENVFDAGTVPDGDSATPGPGQYPSAGMRHGQVARLMLEVLAETRDPELKTALIMALAKIGDPPRVDPEERLALALLPYLQDSSQEVRETATLGLGVLGDRQVGPDLAHLLHDTPEGRKLVGRARVTSRTRIFAAYAVLLLGHRARHESERAWAVHHLLQAYDADDVRGPDLRVACVMGMGLLPLEVRAAAEPADGEDEAGEPEPTEGRAGQLAWVQGVLADRRGDEHVRAFAAVAAARLAAGLEPDAGIPLGELLLELSAPRAKTSDTLREGLVHALGLLGNNGVHPLDRSIRARLRELAEEGTRLERNLALVALARVLGRDGESPQLEAVLEGRAFLSGLATDGDSAGRPWATLALGLLEREWTRSGHDPALGTREFVKGLIEKASSPNERGAVATALGLMGERSAAEPLIELLPKGDETLRGHVAIALGMLHATEASPELTYITVVKGPPSLSRECAIALGMMGDHSAWRDLAGTMRGSRFLSVTIGRLLALAYVADARAVSPLMLVLADEKEESLVRAYAAVALGVVCHKDRLPWNSALAQDVPWRSAPVTLLDLATGRGVLDLF